MTGTLRCISPIDGSLVAERPALATAAAREAAARARAARADWAARPLSVIGYHNLTRPKSYHPKKVTT